MVAERAMAGGAGDYISDYFSDYFGDDHISERWRVEPGWIEGATQRMDSCDPAMLGCGHRGGSCRRVLTEEAWAISDDPGERGRGLGPPGGG